MDCFQQRSNANRRSASGLWFMKKRLELVAGSFCASVAASGKIDNWLTDNVIGLIIGPSFQEAVDEIVLNLSRSLDFEIKARETAKPMRVHLYSVETGRVVGAVTGFEMGRLFEEQVIVK
jgi:hypothetical protein